MSNLEERIAKEEDAKKHRITVGEIRDQLKDLNNDCVVYFGSEDGELFFCQVKSRGRDEREQPNLISFELSTAENILENA